VVWQIPVVLSAYGLLVLMAFWRSVPYAVQAGVLLFLTYGLGVFNLFISGQTGDGFPFLLALPVLAALFFGRRVGAWAVAISTVTLSLFARAFVTGAMTLPPDQMPDVAELGSWVSRILVFVMLVLLLLLPQDFLFQRLVTALTRSRELADALEKERAGLEAAVGDRTADLARKSAQLEAAAQVARDAAAIRDVQELLDETVRLISDRFDFYHTGLFLLDETRSYAVLRAASSEGGARMLARGHRLRVGETGIVGYVTGTGHPRIALDVGADAVFFDNPDLPDTRSEAALPLTSRGEIIGALDVQSVEPGAFSQDDVSVLQILADQVAVAISNARLYQRVQQSLEAERRAYGEMSLEAWRDLLRREPQLWGRYDPDGILPEDSGWRREMQWAFQQEKVIRGQDGAAASLAIPIRVRDQTIGVLDAHKPEEGKAWTEEEIATLHVLVEQLGVALESARLYQDTLRRAAQDRVVSQATTRMRESFDLDRVLESAADEVYKTLGLDRVVIRLTSGDD
jgi:GAF domain-containing protein